jgi:hypothetical protein
MIPPMRRINRKRKKAQREEGETQTFHLHTGTSLSSDETAGAHQADERFNRRPCR